MNSIKSEARAGKHFHHPHHQQEQQQQGSGSGSGSSDQPLYEELAQFISASIADMNAFPSVKREKSLNVQDPVAQLQQHISSKTHTSESSSSSEAVQQSQVSSSKPSIVGTDILGSLLLEALEGFIFVVNGQGKVEFVSENITLYLKYTQDDLFGKSIYNIIHVGDHAQFSNSLVPMSLATSLSWPNDSPNKGHNFTCRMLIKPPCDEDDDVEVKQTYVSQYESMHITAILQPYKFSEVHSDSENPTCLVCIARRVPMTEKVNVMLGIDQFTTKQDLQGLILASDVRNLNKDQYGDVSLSGKIFDFCHSNDLNQLRKHIAEVVKNVSNTSGVYRFKLQEGRYVFVQTKSKLFYNSSTQAPDYILSTHSIIRECDSEVELKGSASTSLMKSIIGQAGHSHRSQPHMSLAGLSSPPVGGSFSFSMFSSLPPTPSLPVGMGSMGNLSSSGGVGGGGSVDALEDFDFFNTDWDSLTPSVGVGGSMLGGGGGGGGDSFNGDVSMSPNVSGINVSSHQSYPLQTSAAVSWGSNMPKTSSTLSSLQSVLLGNGPMGNLTNSHANTMVNNNNSSGGAVTMVSNANGKPHPSPLSMAQRNSSLSFDGQKSPRFTPSPNGQRASGGFSVPNQRGSMGYPNQRSPGSAAAAAATAAGLMQNRNHGGQFGMGYRKTVSPLVSPQPGLPPPSPVWGRSPNTMASSASDFGGMGGPGSVGSMVSQPSPLQALQSMDGTQTSSGLDLLSPRGGHGGHHDSTFPGSTPPYDASPGMGDVRAAQRPGKLCQLLTQNTSLDPLGLRSSHSSVAGPRPSSTKSASSMASPGCGKKSPDDSFHQSPTPGPGTSPPEKPQSTSNEDDMASGSSTSEQEKKDNFILKKLLSQEEDGEPPTIMDQEISSSPQTSGATASSGDRDKDKNEAEPKKTSNVLLKQLLSEENRKEQAESLQKRFQLEIRNPSTPVSRNQASSSGGELGKLPGELLHHLLQDEGEATPSAITSAPAESTSEEGSGSRSRHQSGQQEPQSTTSLPLTPSPSHLPGLTPSQQQMLHDIFENKSLAMSLATSTLTSTTAGGGGGSKRKSNDMTTLSQVLNEIWDRSDTPPPNGGQAQAGQVSQTGQPTQTKSGSRKRKSPSSDADSTEGDTEPSTSSVGGAVSSAQGALSSSRLSQKNALLAQLLSKKAARETVVNTQLTVNPMGLPQQRMPKNLNDRILNIKGKAEDGHVESSSVGVEGGGCAPSSTRGVATSTATGNLHGNLYGNPRTNPNTPFPGNTSGGASANAADTSSVFDGSMDMGDDSVSQFDQISQLVSNMRGSRDGDLSSDDPLLQQILNQAASLEADLLQHSSAASSLPPTPSTSTQAQSSMPPSQGSPLPSSQHIQHMGQPAGSVPLPPPQHFSLTPVDHDMDITQDDQTVLLQLEQLLAEGGLQGMESLLGMAASASSPAGRMEGQGHGGPGAGGSTFNEQMAINAIQQQLMGDDPMGNGMSMSGGGGPLRSPNTPGGVFSPNNNPPLSPVTGMGPRGMMGAGAGGPPRHPQMLGMGPRSFPAQMSPGQQGQQPGVVSPGQQPPRPMFSPTGMPPQSPQYQQPRGPLASALQGGQQAFAPRPGQQVRQTLLKQQQTRALEKRQRQQVQERQRMLQMHHQQRLIQQQQTQQQQQAPQQFGQRFPQQPAMPSMESGTTPGQFPENLRDLMNTGHAPNVTIPAQRGGVLPGSVSPRLPLPPSGAMGGQGAPGRGHYPLGQWGTGEAMLGLHPLPQGAQFSGMQRHRSLSGNAIPTSAGPQGARFQFPGEAPQFSAPPGQAQMGPMFSPSGTGPQPPPGSTPQQQQMFQQNRMLQRSLSMNTGRGSPRASQSPFTGSPDPLLLSPHAMSPNSALRQQQQQQSQVSPPFSQGPMTPSPFNPAGAQSGFPGPPVATATSQSFTDFSDFPDFMNSPLPESKKHGGGEVPAGSQASVGQYVKQELRNICRERSEKTQQTQIQQHLQQQHLQQQQHQQQQQQQQQKQQQPAQSSQGPMQSSSSVDYDSSSELPAHILETINDMSADHGGPLAPDEIKEEEIVAQSRKDAKARYHQFRALSTSNPGSVAPEMTQDGAEAKATSLFRNQLLTPQQIASKQAAAASKTPTSTTTQAINILQKEPRTAVEIKPTDNKNDNKNSLLQQLLADC